MFAKLGAKVVVIEFMENILQMLDVDLKVWAPAEFHRGLWYCLIEVQ